MFSFERRGLGLILLAFGILLPAFSQQASAQNWAEKMFNVKSHDFRSVGRGTKSVFHFDFSNLYEEDVHVAAVRTSCGCTTPTISQKTLKTHETASVKATFNTSSFVGQKSATITVVFDRPAYAEVQLKVSGYIRTDITFDPPEINYGELAAGTSREQTVTITHRGNTAWKFQYPGGYTALSKGWRTDTGCWSRNAAACCRPEQGSQSPPPAGTRCL